MKQRLYNSLTHSTNIRKSPTTLYATSHTKQLAEVAKNGPNSHGSHTSSGDAWIHVYITTDYANERTRLHDELCEKRRPTEERFSLLLQTMHQSGQTRINHQTPPITQSPTLRIPASANRLSNTSWRKSWKDCALINRKEQHNRPTQRAALHSLVPRLFDESITIEALTPDQHTVEEY